MKTITLLNIQPKPFTRAGVKHERTNHDGTFNADIVKGESIRVYGQYTNRFGGPAAFDRTFRVGDEIEVGSYNLTYTGWIINISDKAITFRKGPRTVPGGRLELCEFIARNWDFDKAQIERNNAIEMECI